MAIYDGPMPPGYTPWGNSRVTSAMGAWAHQLEMQTRAGEGHYGEIFHDIIDGVPVAARVEHHVWTTNSKGERVNCPGDGCHGVTLYHPPANVVIPTSQPEPAPAPAQDNTARTISFLILGTALFSTALSVGMTWFRAHPPARATRR